MATVDEFLQHLTESGLFSEKELRALTENSGDGTRDARDLASELIEEKKLTAYQANAIYQGHPQRLVIGRNYIIEDLIGSGGMGMVFRARHRRMRRTVALKVLTSQAMNDEEAIQRFYQEVEVAATLDHRNIVRAYDADESKGVHYLVMEYVRGNDLQQIVEREGQLPIGQAINCMIQAAQGLGHAHKQRVVHRDIKPANLLLNSEGLVKILDMGLARINNPLGDAEGSHKGLTLPGSIMGTVDFMAPEQAADTTQADERSDVYSLGCTLFYILVGTPLFDGSTAMVKLINHREAEIPKLSQVRGDVLPNLDAVLEKMVAKKPEDRYQTMAEVIDALSACRTESEDKTRETVTQYLSPEIRGNILSGVYNTTTGEGSNTRIHKAKKAEAESLDSSAPLPPSELDRPSGVQKLADAESTASPAGNVEAAETVDTPNPLQSRADIREEFETAVSQSKPAPQAVTPPSPSTTQMAPPGSPKGHGLLIAMMIFVIGAGTAAVLFLETPQMLAALFGLAAFLVMVLLFRPPTPQVPQNTGGQSHSQMRSRTSMDEDDYEHIDESEKTLDAQVIIGGRDSLQEAFGAESFGDAASTGAKSITVKRLSETAKSDVPKKLIAPFDEWDIARNRREWSQFLGIPGELVNSVGTRMLLIPTGEFLMGSPQMEEGHVADEKQHLVRITRPFLIASHPVTVAEFQKFVKETNHKTAAEQDSLGGFGFETSKGKIERSSKFSWKNPGFDQTGSHPVVNITWDDAHAFCEWLSKREKMNYRLPTEAEWEFSCRAGTESRFFCGDDPEHLVKYGNVADASTKAKFPTWPTITSYGGYIFTAPVESFEPNAFGLHDMHGNVWEWCADRYGQSYYQEAPLKDPEGPLHGDKRVLRGGSWMNAPLLTRSAKRLNQRSDQFFLANGFRVAATP